MEKLSVIIIAKNEEPHIKNLMSSIKLLAPFEVLLIDSLSTDNTVNLALEAGASVFKREWTGYVDQRNFGLEQASGTWVLYIDADERVTPALAAEIKSVINAPNADGYNIPRLNWYLGRPIRCAYPDAILRLARRSKCKWVGGKVHERLHVEGKVGTLCNHFTHKSYESLTDQTNKLARYASLMADSRIESGRRFKYIQFLSPLWVVIRLGIFKGGFFCGLRGQVFVCAQFIYTLQKVLFMAEKAIQDRNNNIPFE